MTRVPEYIAQPLFAPATEALRHLPECPRVLRHTPNQLAWIAIQHSPTSTVGSLNVLNLDTLHNREHPLPARPGFFVETTKPGVLLVGLERRLVLYDLNTATLQELGVNVTTDERVLINDGLAIPGGVIFGTKHLEFNQPIAKVYHFDAHTRQVREIIDGQICSNGKFYQPAERRLIDIDSIPRTITEYVFDSDWHIAKQRPVVDPASLPAIPDGLRPCPFGETVIVAYYNPDSKADGLAQQFDIAGGKVVNHWRLPGSPRVTCPEFFVRDGRVCLLFTTAVEGMPADERPHAPRAGDLFWAETPYTQLPPAPPLVELT
jgi:sugar lactone lactonase YvrE